MASEHQFIEQLKSIAKHPVARGLADDAAVLTIGRQKIVLTHDMLVEGIHFPVDADPADVAWKLAAVNLSDLAAKGAKPLGLLMGVGGMGDDKWQAGFLEGLSDVIQTYGAPLIGGDTVSQPAGTGRSFGMTAIGEARGPIVQSRADAQPGDILYVTGSIGDGWAGLQVETGALDPADDADRAELLRAYRRPHPRLSEGRALGPLVHAMMDVSDGLLLDARRMAQASGVGMTIDLDAIPLSGAFRRLIGSDADAAMLAATGGDDYQLLFATGIETVLPVDAVAIGRCHAGEGLELLWQGETVQPPERLGYVHS